MTGYERVEAVFAGKKPDRIPVGEDFWGETLATWRAQGRLPDAVSPIDHFALDTDRAGLINWYVDPTYVPETVAEDEITVVKRDGNGALMRHYKAHTTTPECVGFTVSGTQEWHEFAKPRLLDLDPRRIPFESYRRRRAAAESAGRHFAADAFGPFELMHRIIGHEAMLTAMALEPEWIVDMVTTYTDFNIRHWEELFAREGLPHAMWIADDLGYKLKPFMSPAMFTEILKPSFDRMCDFLHGRGLKVILHSCGFVEPLLPSLIDAGIDCLEAMERKAGMDIRALNDAYGEHLVWFGNIDIRALETNDADEVARELDRVLSVLHTGGRYIAHSDHSISPVVEYDTYRAFLERVRARR